MTDPRHSSEPLSIGQCATLACLLEATASKAGNVHRGADFDDLRFEQFVVSAVAIAPAIELASDGVGAAILAAVKATRAWANTNTNLGMLLLIAPLAAVPRSIPLAQGIGAVLESLTEADSAAAYEAIRIARPGGMGEVNEMDVAGPAPPSLLEAMRAASSRDLIARQYVNGFAEVFGEVVPQLAAGLAEGRDISQVIIHAHLQLLHKHPDSLIARKAGLHVAEHASWQAGAVLNAGPPGSEEYEGALADFDFWLRSDGHARNPGTSADLIAAGLFAVLREGVLKPPLTW